MRSDDYLLRECYIFRTIVVDLRHMFTVIPMNLFEQAVIHIYNGKSVKNVYYDRPFRMDIASLVFYNFFLPIVRKQWVSFTLADDELCRLVITQNDNYHLFYIMILSTVPTRHVE